MTPVGLIPDRKAVNLIGEVYDDAAKKLTKIYTSVYPITEFKLSDTPGLLKQVRSIVNKLDRFAITWSRRAVTDSYKESRGMSETKLRALKEEPDEDFDKSIHKITVDQFSEATTEDLVTANQSILVTSNIYFEIIGKAKEDLLELQAWDMMDEETISELLDDAIRDGESRGQVAKRIRTHFEKIIGNEQYIRINSRNYNMKSYSKMVARTRLRKVQSEATRNTCQEFEHDLVEISDHGTETAICEEFEGEIFSLFGDSKNVPVLSSEPPFHPNCMHSMFPTSETAVKVGGR